MQSNKGFFQKTEIQFKENLTVAAAAKKNLGFKRICTSCGTRYYDFAKRPIICPSCSAEFNPEYRIRGRKGRISAEIKREEEEVKKPQVVSNDEEALEEDEELEVVSLEDVEEDDDADEEDEAPAKVVEEEEIEDLPDLEDDDLDDDEEDVLEDEEDED